MDEAYIKITHLFSLKSWVYFNTRIINWIIINLCFVRLTKSGWFTVYNPVLCTYATQKNFQQIFYMQGTNILSSRFYDCCTPWWWASKTRNM